MRGLWLVQWTGDGAIIGYCAIVLYARTCNQQTLRLEARTSWRIRNGILQPYDWRTMERAELEQVLCATEHYLSRFGAIGGASIREFRPNPIYVHPVLASEFWLGSLVGLKALLLKNATEYNT